MISELAIFYLFLGGAGAGTLAVCALADLCRVRRVFGPNGGPRDAVVRGDTRVVNQGFVAGLLILAVGVACLVLDLGRADRVLALFLHPTFSVMSVGAWVLTLLVLAGAFLALTALLYFPGMPRRIIVVVEVATVVLGVAAMVYTGLLLATTGGVALWWSPWLPVLFLLSSSSAGIAVVVLLAAVPDDRAKAGVFAQSLVRVDTLIIVLELLCAAAFVLESLRDANPGTVAGIGILLRGDEALVWWAGFVALGMVVPLLLELLSAHGGAAGWQVLALAALCVLVGAFCLRWSIAQAGVLRVVVMEDPGMVYSFWN